MKLWRESSFKKDMHRTMIRIIKLLKTAKENYGLRKKRKYNKMDNTSKTWHLKLQPWLSLQHLTKLSSLILSRSSLSFSIDWNGAWKISNFKRQKHFNKYILSLTTEQSKIVPSLGLIKKI